MLAVVLAMILYRFRNGDRTIVQIAFIFVGIFASGASRLLIGSMAWKTRPVHSLQQILTLLTGELILSIAVWAFTVRLWHRRSIIMAGDKKREEEERNEIEEQPVPAPAPAPATADEPPPPIEPPTGKS